VSPTTRGECAGSLGREGDQAGVEIGVDPHGAEAGGDGGQPHLQRVEQLVPPQRHRGPGLEAFCGERTLDGVGVDTGVVVEGQSDLPAADSDRGLGVGAGALDGDEAEQPRGPGGEVAHTGGPRVERPPV